jgi:anti-sigma B factor antagonist
VSRPRVPATRAGPPTPEVTALSFPASRGPSRPGGLDTGLTRPAPGVHVLVVVGEVDTLTAPALAEALTGLLATEPLDAVAAVDLTGVGFLASSGLAVLIRAAHTAESQGRALHLLGGTRAVTRPLEVTGSDQLFTLLPGLHELLARVEGDRPTG